MAKKNLGELIINSIFFGVGAWFFGFIATGLVVELILERTSLYGSIVYSLVGACISTVITIGILIYRFKTRDGG